VIAEPEITSAMASWRSRWSSSALALQAEADHHYAQAKALWRDRDEVSHERALLLRQVWRLGGIQS
jgi:hypothetical protein